MIRTIVAIVLLAAACARPQIRAAGERVVGEVMDAYHPEDPARLRAPHGVRGAIVHGALAWIVPVEGGVVVVDPGFEESAALLRRQIGEARVLAVLATHAHVDHLSGARALDAPTYIGEADLPFARNERPFRAAAPRLAVEVLGAPPPPQDLRGVRDGERIAVGGAEFRAVALPGHTPGSTAWLYRDVLFSGDAISSLDGESINLSPWPLSEDPGEVPKTPRRLAGVPFRVMCDAHWGCFDDAARKVAAVARLDRDISEGYWGYLWRGP
jgi:glyoxylase-like metal-dependent hydrolase (beta-lactamase superfamily II)